MVQVVAANYGFQYAQNLIKKATEALSQHCTDNCLLFHSRENSFVFYLFDYKDQKELVAFGNVIADTLGSIFITERIGGGIGLEIEQNQSELNVDLQLRRLLIASETSVSMFGRILKFVFTMKSLKPLLTVKEKLWKLSAPLRQMMILLMSCFYSISPL